MCIISEPRAVTRDAGRQAKTHNATRHGAALLTVFRVVFCPVNFDYTLSQKAVLYQGIELVVLNLEGNNNSPAVLPLAITTHAAGGRGKGVLCGHGLAIGVFADMSQVTGCRVLYGDRSSQGTWFACWGILDTKTLFTVGKQEASTWGHMHGQIYDHLPTPRPPSTRKAEIALSERLRGL